MLAASLWSLLLPAIEESMNLGKLSFLPSAAGFFVGVMFMMLSEKAIDRFSSSKQFSLRKRSFITAFAVTVHNIPEGLAVGMVYAALLNSTAPGTAAGAIALSLGIAIQNIPEGAIVSLPLYSGGISKLKAFSSGVFSGAVEPVAATTAILFVKLFSPLMPFFLSFAAGAMIFVVMRELSEEMRSESSRGMIFFAFGFIIMMSLDVALG